MVAATVWKPVDDRPSLRLLFVPAAADDDEAESEVLGARDSLVGAMLNEPVGLVGGYGSAEAELMCALIRSTAISATANASSAVARREIGR